MEKLTRKEAFQLGVDAYYKKSSVAEFSAEERIEGLKNYLTDLNKNFRMNQNEIFQIIEDVANEILPKRVYEAVKQFAEFKQFGNNEQVRFKINQVSRIKAYVVALGGSVKRVRLDKGWFTFGTEAIQCKVYEEYERVIGGQVDWTALINACVDAIQLEIMKKIHDSLVGVYALLPNANSHTTTNFDAVEFDKILNVIKAYGQPVIMGTPLAVAQVPAVSANDTMAIEDIRNMGYVGKYKGCAVVELAQSFEDGTNAKKVFSDEYLFIIPAGSEKIIKVAMEGGLVTREEQGKDWTYNFAAYQKVGCAVPLVNHIGMFKMSSLA